MLGDILLIIVGLILLTGLLGVIPAMGKHLEKLAKWLGSIQGIIGIIALIYGIWNFSIPSGLMLIIAGIILAVGILQILPAVGEELKKLAKTLGSFQTIIGIIALVIGIWGLL